MTPIRWFIFDLGGLFVAEKSEAILDAVANRARVDAGRWKTAIQPYLAEATRGKMTLLEVYTRAAEDCRVAGPADPLLACHLDLYREFSSHHDPRMLELVRRLRTGHSVACLSNLEPEIAAMARASGLFAHFDRCYLSVEMGLKKPDPEIYVAVLADLTCGADEVVFIDDRPENVAGAEGVGMNTVIFKTVDQLTGDLAAYSTF